MSNLFAILFAVLDCCAWSHGQLVAWADQLISKLERPNAWLAELSISRSLDDALNVIRRAMKESGVLLPDNIGDLMVGLVLLRFSNGELSSEAARTQIVEIVDAYGASGVDAEAAGRLEFGVSVYAQLRMDAELAMKHLAVENVLEFERRMIED